MVLPGVLEREQALDGKQEGGIEQREQALSEQEEGTEQEVGPEQEEGTEQEVGTEQELPEQGVEQEPVGWKGCRRGRRGAGSWGAIARACTGHRGSGGGGRGWISSENKGKICSSIKYLWSKNDL